LAHPELLSTQEVEITVLLGDLRNSTPLAEKLGAHGMLGLLNEVLTAQIAAVLKEQATLEHFVGDQFLAYWGAPEPRRDSADAAYRAATALIRSVLEVGARQRSDVKALFGFGVALHSGRCVIGHRGSAQRLEYGIVGDLINAAARVESLTKRYGVRLLATREVVDRMAHPPRSRLVDHVRVVGKKEPIEIIELENPENTRGFGRLADEYGRAFSDYVAGDFSQALLLFESLARSGDLPSQVLAERCRRFSQQPPAEWSAIYSLETK
jgi:adenylate cyclase